MGNHFKWAKCFCLGLLLYIGIIFTNSYFVYLAAPKRGISTSICELVSVIEVSIWPNLATFNFVYPVFSCYILFSVFPFFLVYPLWWINFICLGNLLCGKVTVQETCCSWNVLSGKYLSENVTAKQHMYMKLLVWENEQNVLSRKVTVWGNVFITLFFLCYALTAHLL